jgi:outer membrane lipopolysaccharide assembly protein LptE/RlpB
MKCAAALLPVLIILAGPGCGYHTSGRSTTLPQDVHTIAIPNFTNYSHTYRIDQMLTEAVVREFTTRTRYHIENDPRHGSDAILQGTILNTMATPSTYDSQTGRASSVTVTVSMRVTLTDTHGKILYQNASYQFRDQYQVSRELSSFFEEDSPALERLSRSFARTLVSNILEGF